MTESNWQGDMLRQMAEQSPAEDPARPDNPPAPAPAAPPAAPAGQGGPGVPPAPQQGPYQHQQGPYQQQYGQQPPPPGPPPQYQQPYPQPTYPQEQYPPQQYPQQPQYRAEQYPSQQPPYPPEQYAPEPPYPQQPPYPPYQPGPYEQQQYVPPPPYQPAPYEQYPPQPYQQYPPYEQQQPLNPQPQYEEQYPPQGQHHPGQVSHQDYYEQPPHQGPPTQDDGWGAPAPPTPQSDQIGTPMQGPGGDSVFDRFRRIASEAAYLVGASGRMQRDVDNIAMIRRPIAIMRRIGVLSPVTNGGTSTVTALLSTMLAAQRSDRVVAVDADPGGAELSRRLEFSVGAGPIERVTLLRSEGTAEAVRTTLAEAQGQGARDVGLAVVDCPGGLFDEIPAELAGSGHCAVVVVPSVQHVANYCLAQLDQLTPGGQDVLLTRGIVVITMVENVDPASVTWLVEAFRQRGMEPAVLPFDLHIAQSWPLRTEQLQSDTRRVVLDLAARVVETVTRTAG